MGIEISLLFPSAFMIGVEYFESNYPGEHQELDLNFGFIRVTFIWWLKYCLYLLHEKATKQSHATAVDWHREIAWDQESDEADEEDHDDGGRHVNGIEDEGHHEGKKHL